MPEATAAGRSGSVRNGFDGASTQTSSTPGGGGSAWSKRTWRSPQPLQLAEEGAGAVVRVLRERHRVARAQEPEHERGRRGHAGGEEDGLAAVERPERALGLGPGGVRVPRVVKGAGLPVLVWPRGGAVERRLHPPTVTRSCAR